MKKPPAREFFKTPKGTELRLLNLRGKEYLEVSQRIVWFREEHANWRITTELVRLENNHAIVCARILDQDGQVMAMSHKREDHKSFPDFMEKAETGAIGRALALVGYGTQFCADELEEGPRVVDAPQALQTAAEPTPLIGTELEARGAVEPEECPVKGRISDFIDHAQAQRLNDHAKAHGWSAGDVSRAVHLWYSRDKWSQLTQGQLRALWNYIRSHGPHELPAALG